MDTLSLLKKYQLSVEVHLKIKKSSYRKDLDHSNSGLRSSWGERGKGGWIGKEERAIIFSTMHACIVSWTALAFRLNCVVHDKLDGG